MSDQLSTTIRPELVDVATGFLKNSKIISEKMERKREFLQKKGLTDTEIHQAFQLISQPEITEQIISNHRPSFLHRFLNDLAFAGLLLIALKTIKHLFDTQNQSDQTNETIKNLQKSVGHMQTTVVKLEQTVDQLNSSMQTATTTRSSTSSIEEIKREVQLLKGLYLGRSQFPQIPSRQFKTAEKIGASASLNNETTIDKDDNDGIIIESEQDTKSDDKNQSSNEN